MPAPISPCTLATSADPCAVAVTVNVLGLVSAQLLDIALDVERSVNGVCSGFQGMTDRLKKAVEICSPIEHHASESSVQAIADQLNLDIVQAVVAMQFQDRVNQRIQHLVATIDDLAQELRPNVIDAEQEKVHSLTEFWLERMNDRSTMQAERRLLQAEQPESDLSPVELF